MATVLQRRQLVNIPSAWLERVGQARTSCAPIVGYNQRRGVTTRDLDRRKGDRERVVILGSGWAGYTLSRELDPKKYQPVVVSPRSYFVFTPLLASTSVGTLEFRTALESVRSQQTNVEFLQGWADDICLDKKSIVVEESVADQSQGLALTGDRQKVHEDPEKVKAIKASKGGLFDLHYDKLIIAVGCYSQTFGIKGVKENAFFLKDVGDARRIRRRILECFETASLPTTSDKMRRQLLNFAVVGGGPTGIEFSAELHDLIKEDLAKLYPTLIDEFRITVYDVAPKVLSMFDENLGKYAMNHFHREGINIRTSHHPEELRLGVPQADQDDPSIRDKEGVYTLRTTEEGEVGVGMCVWSTGLMPNPFIQKTMSKVRRFPSPTARIEGRYWERDEWYMKQDGRTKGVFTDDKLRVKLVSKPNGSEPVETVMKDVYAIGDCAVMEGTMYPATAQVANQKAGWLAKRLNKDDTAEETFAFKNRGIMAYLGNWRAIMQAGSGGNISGRAAWFVWRGAYLTKSVSWRNRILIPIYW
ncbi:FAD/NAD(P)-binding domain-containing protein [Xylona heveae TC161]|uniref:FAD/NAD(P)-binding domain-containing protein n=1 Tax=Xylona heveae (strain CBS 132557 / TC161) TaxID=1328760 RepID=A0A165ICY4_XYLHT|nr:FAD/NAD(P)-binding domain-containing protein [Xylona heveae TC161]KZF24722.1 FAD/NAD(P)-binding domain-containing protein [Xylona heveae TC161]